jgi:putative endonuclease
MTFGKLPKISEGAVGSNEDSSEWTVYIVRCIDETLYTGVAKDLASRISQHNSGRGAKYTKGRRPVSVVYQERARDRGAALRREIAIKRLSLREKRALLTR